MAAEMLDQAEETIIDFITCPACLDYIRPPSYCCDEGHFVCKECRDSTPRCPVCGTDHYPNKNNFVFDAILKEIYYPCVHQENGCTEFFKYDEVHKHAEECGFQVVSCAFLRDGCQAKLLACEKPTHEETCEFGVSCKVLFRVRGHLKSSCSWRGGRDELVGHVSREHKVAWYSPVVNCNVAAMWMLPLNIDFEKIDLLVVADIEQMFWVYTKVVAEDTQTVAVQFIGPARKAADFTYSIEFRNLPKRITFEDGVLSPAIRHCDIYSAPNCLHSKYGFLKTQFFAERIIDYYVKISKKEQIELRKSITYHTMGVDKDWNIK